mgnify:CR=1 FL=1
MCISFNLKKLVIPNPGIKAGFSYEPIPYLAMAVTVKNTISNMADLVQYQLYQCLLEITSRP